MNKETMWTCPKCKRIFKKTNQHHYCGKAPTTIEEYISNQEIEKQPYLIELHQTIKKSIPQVQEKIAWSMPTYVLNNHNILNFCANKKDIGIYVDEEIIHSLKEELATYKTNKSALHLPYTHLPLSLIQKICTQIRLLSNK